MLTANYKDMENIVDIVRDALADDRIRMECAARDRYERDRTSLYNSGRREATKEAIIKAVKMSKEYNVTKEAATDQLVKQFQLSPEEASEIVNSNWK